MTGDRYSYWKKYIESRLIDFLPVPGEQSRILFESMEYSLLAGGKRLRPLLLLETCSVCGGDPERAVPYACAIEFIHTYSLIHDDHPSMDNDDLRRGKPTNHIVYGDGIAILAGDGLLNSAFDIMAEDMLKASERGVNVTPLLRASYEISSAAGVRGMIAGQTADLENTGKNSRDSELLLYIHRNKTGALIRAAVRAGALLGGASESQLKVLTEYAENMGLAFQISDDILDVTGDPEKTGKRTGMDAFLGKLTYPSVYGLEESRKRLEAVTEKAVEAAEHFGSDGGFLAELAIDLKNRAS